jgi:hypothetical protein
MYTAGLTMPPWQPSDKNFFSYRIISYADLSRRITMMCRERFFYIDYAKKYGACIRVRMPCAERYEFFVDTFDNINNIDG